MSIGDRLREERERLGFSQPALAGLAETTKKSQIDYEKGVTFPKANYLEVVARVGVDVQYVVTGTRSIANLGADEELLLAGYRQMDIQTKQRLMAFVTTGDAGSDASIQVRGNVGQRFEQAVSGGSFKVNMANIDRDKK